MPAQIEGGRWDSWFRRYFSIKTDSISPEVSDFIQPVLSIPQGIEAEFLLKDKLCMGYAVITAAAGQFPRVVLNNPNNSGHLIVLEKLIFQAASGAVQIDHFRNFAIPSGTAVTRIRDTRWGGIRC